MAATYLVCLLACGGNDNGTDGDLYNLEQESTTPLPTNNQPTSPGTQPPPGGNGTPVGDTFTNFTREKMQLHCVSCHSRYSNYTTVATNAASIKKTIVDKSMPPLGSPPIPQADIDRLRAWFDAGAPQ